MRVLNLGSVRHRSRRFCVAPVCFDDFLPEDKKGVTYYPEDLREEIDGVNDWIYNTINK